ncbi:MAG: 2-hydroxyacid dehydrogenase [Spirochaetia bacterium]|nr:2-hydroxyacid dehydrogenase [Treponema sp.]MCI6315574.1 2-hydroxyacid dehydrogenase [Spirochaetia bacterium]MCI6545779.1 2-hydroxyacid dehydrogenase [Spirochaetia bacterium]MCI7436407.1 2-hydroxyacid dehydrogenase [Spirochaetia bacterium]MDY2825075.1 2-hydroxyacid dehydrogenase [Treponema sp.]
MSKIAFFDTRSYDKEAFTKENEKFGYEIDFFDFKLNEKTALTAKGFDAVCVFVNDVVNADVISILKNCGIKIILLRCAGFNNVDLAAAEKAGIQVVRVPAYSPHAVAEHGAALLLSLTRHIPQAYLRTKTVNFNIEGLTGRDLFGLTAGVFGTGKIGQCMADILKGFGMKVICYDPFPNEKWAKEKGFSYVDIDTIFKESDVLSFHCPLTDETYHIVNHDNMKKMKSDAVIINTGRGALIDTKALVHALKHKHIGGAALDVYEEESAFFFKDCSAEIIADDVLARLLTFPNVLITGHQAFLTTTALSNIAEVTLNNFSSFLSGKELVNKVQKK